MRRLKAGKIASVVMALAVVLSILCCTAVSSKTAYADDSIISAGGIYVAECNRNEVVAGMVVNNPDGAALEYLWTVYNKTEQKTETIQGWTEGSEWITWEPDSFGEYVLICDARLKSNPNMRVTASSEAFWFNPYIKGKCQMPYWGEGGGYLIGVESYENPEQSYYYEMLILDCTLLAEGKDAWVYTTGKYRVDEGNAGWCIWQPVYGYYWTLFRVYDADGEMLDQACYGFANIGETGEGETPTEGTTEGETPTETETESTTADSSDTDTEESTEESTQAGEEETTSQGSNPFPYVIGELIPVAEVREDYTGTVYKAYGVWDIEAKVVKDRTVIDKLLAVTEELKSQYYSVAGAGPAYYGEYDEGLIVEYEVVIQGYYPPQGPCPYPLYEIMQDGTAYYIYFIDNTNAKTEEFKHIMLEDSRYQYVEMGKYIGFYDEGRVKYSRIDIVE